MDNPATEEEMSALVGGTVVAADTLDIEIQTVSGKVLVLEHRTAWNDSIFVVREKEVPQ